METSTRELDADKQIFTVEQDEQGAQLMRYKRGNTYFLSATKCILSVFKSILLIVCVIASKLSLIYLGQRLNHSPAACSSTSSQSCDYSICGGTSTYACETTLDMLMMALVSPSVYTFIRAVFTSDMKKSHPWPTKRTLL